MRAIEKLRKLEQEITPGPWSWSGVGLITTKWGRWNAEHIIWPRNATDPDSLDPPVGPNETGPRWWSALLGSCGKHTETQSHFNGMFISEIRNHLPALLNAMEKLMEEVAFWRLDYTGGHLMEWCDEAKATDLAMAELEKVVGT